MANLINSAEVRETWAPIIESATGINEAEKLAWMSEYCHNHKLYEDAHIMSLGTAGNIYGMGNVSLPNVATGADGSGDKAPTLLPLAMQVAAQTIGLDLVPVVPMAGPMGLLSYLDFVYEGGKTAGDTAPTYIKADKGVTILTGDENVGSSRIDGKDIIRIGKTTDALLDSTNIDPAAVVTMASLYAGAELVKALEDHIKGFAAADKDGNPFSRGVGEQTPDKVMGLSLFSKSVAAETFQVAAAVTREQIQDLKQFGVDAVAQVESVLTNELTQSINNLILAKLNSLGKQNLGYDGLGGAFTSILDLKLDLAADYLGGETNASQHRRILTGILAAANFIANKGRRGAGNFCVVGPKVATALQSVAGFVANPMANTLSQAAGAIYPVGSVAGVNVYTDPRQAWEGAAGNVYEVLVGRKGDGNGPGLVFMPYLMAESVQAIAEGTMAPKVAVKSRFALVEAGFHPETQYATFNVEGLVL